MRLALLKAEARGGKFLLSVDGHAVLGHLVLAFLQIGNDFLGQLCQIFALDEVISLQEYLTQSALSDGIVFQVELVKAMVAVFVGLK